MEREEAAEAEKARKARKEATAGEGASGAKPLTQKTRYSGKGTGTSGNRGRHGGKGKGLTTTEAEALKTMKKADLVSDKKGEKGGTQADVEVAQAKLDKAVKEARKAELQHAQAKEAVEMRKRKTLEEDVEQDDGGGGVGIRIQRCEDGC